METEDKRKQKEELYMKEATAKTLVRVESLNIEEIGFISIAKKLYIKHKEMKISL